MITYTKLIRSLDCYAQIDGETDVVFTIQWTLCGTEGIYSSSAPYSTSIPYLAGTEFIPYADLTEAQVLQWIDEYTDPDMMQSYINLIAENIEKQKVIVSPPLPWQPTLG